MCGVCGLSVCDICLWGVCCVFMCLSVCSVCVCVYVCAGCARAAAPLCPLWSRAHRGAVGSRPSQSLSPRAPSPASEPPGPALPVSKPEAEVPAKRSLPGCGGGGGGGGDPRGEAAASCGGRVAVAVPARLPFPRLQQVRARRGGGEGGRGRGWVPGSARVRDWADAAPGQEEGAGADLSSRAAAGRPAAASGTPDPAQPRARKGGEETRRPSPGP